MGTAECNKVTLPAVVKARGPQTARFSPAVVQVCHSPWHEDSLVVDGSMSVTREPPHSSQNQGFHPRLEWATRRPEIGGTGHPFNWPRASLEAVTDYLENLVGPIVSKSVVERHGPSTSTIPKGPLQERRKTELAGRNPEFCQTDCRCSRGSEWQRQGESSEQSNVWWRPS